MADIVSAVVGAGFIGPVHVEALRRAGVPVKGVLDVTPDKSRQAARRFGLHAYSSFAEVLADGDLRAVHIATPNRLHFEMAAAALRAGKHVMCEKPLAMNSRESRELVQLARESALAAGVNYNIRFYPLCREASQRAQAGSLGDVLHVTGSYVQDWLFHPTDFNWRVIAEEGGSLRAVADIGTHWLDLIHSILHVEVEAVCADLKTVFPRRWRPMGEVETFSGKEPAVAATEPIDVTTEDYGCVMLRFRGGASGSLFVSQVTAGRKNCLRYEIAGSEQALSWDSERPNELWIGHRDRPNELLLRDPALMTAEARRFSDYPGGHNEGFPDTFKQCFRAFYESIEAGTFRDERPGFPTFADGHREIVLCEAILKSHRQQGWVNVEL